MVNHRFPSEPTVIPSGSPLSWGCDGTGYSVNDPPAFTSPILFPLDSAKNASPLAEPGSGSTATPSGKLVAVGTGYSDTPPPDIAASSTACRRPRAGCVPTAAAASRVWPRHGTNRARRTVPRTCTTFTCRT